MLFSAIMGRLAPPPGRTGSGQSPPQRLSTQTQPHDGQPQPRASGALGPSAASASSASPSQGTASTTRAGSAGQNGSHASSTLNERHKAPSIPTALGASGKGGGSFRAIDHTVTVNQASGTISLTLPIHTSPGRGGFGPSLGLTYDSGQGNGPFGFGWSLSAEASVRRKTARGVPRYDDTDTFVLSGHEDLVPVTVPEGDFPPVKVDQSSGRRFAVRGYRPRIETEPLRIERWSACDDADEVFWRTIDASNVTTVYGRTPESRIADTSVQPARIFSWLVSLSYDAAGNAIEYVYKVEDAAGIADLPLILQPGLPRRDTADYAGNNKYLASIRYGNRTPNRDFSDWTRTVAPREWLFEVVLDYGEYADQPIDIQPSRRWLLRKDRFSTSSAGLELRYNRLCRRVLMFHHFPEKLDRESSLVSSVALAYDEMGAGSFLSTFTAYGHIVNKNGTFITESMPPRQFVYSKAPSPEGLRLTTADPLDLQNLPRATYPGVQPRWLDLDGEGAPGLLAHISGGWLYQRNESALDSSGLARPSFGQPCLLGSQPTLGNTNHVRFEDLDRNGRMDMVGLDETGRMLGYHERDDVAGWTQFEYFQATPTSSLSLGAFNQADLTGDGLLDIFQIDEDSDSIVWHMSHAKKGFGEELRTRRVEDGPKWVGGPFHRIETYLADMSGDGMADIVQIGNGGISYWPNMGYGRFGKEVMMTNAPVFDSIDQFTHHRLFMADCDGSGTTDLIYVSSTTGATLYYNLAGNGWSEPINLGFFPEPDSISSVVVLDLLGNGTACLCWNGLDSRTGKIVIRYIDLMAGRKPHLLTKYTTGMGASTTVEYTPSTKFYLRDEPTSNRWKTKLPFPVHCVSSIVTVDEVAMTSATTRYSYHHGYYDGVEKEFRGFALVEQWEEERFEVGCKNAFTRVPAHTKTWYYTGSEHDSNMPLVLGSEAVRRTLTSKLPKTKNQHQRHEMFRALKGLQRRQEVYGVMADGSSSTTPYVTTDQSYQVKVIQGALAEVFGVSKVLPRETLTCQYDGGEARDVRIHHDLFLRFNDYGDITREMSVAYGRQIEPSTTVPRLEASELAKQAETFIFTTEREFTDVVDEDEVFQKPEVCSVKRYSLLGVETKDGLCDYEALRNLNLDDFRTVSDLSGLEDGKNGVGKRRILLEETRTYFRSRDMASQLKFGKIEAFSVVYQQFQLALTRDMYEEAYTKHASQLEDFPQEQLRKEGGYVEFNSDGRWWIPSPKYLFSKSKNAKEELLDAMSSFYTPTVTTDGFNHASTVTMDAYNLLPEVMEDAVGNTIRLKNQYGHLQPVEIIDANKNVQQVRLDAFGGVIGVAIMGKEGEGLGDSFDGFKDEVSADDLEAFIQDPTGPVTEKDRKSVV